MLPARGRAPTGDRPYTTPSAAEMAARHAAIRAAMDRAGLDGLVVFGTLASPHAIRYLTGWPPGWESYVVVGPDARPVLLTPSPNHLPTAEDMAGEVADVRWAGPDPVAAVCDALRSSGAPLGRGHRVGVVGPLPHARHVAISAAIDGPLADADDLYVSIRLVKSAAEIERTRRAAGLADTAVEALIAEARPGMTEVELGTIIQSTYRRAGGEDGICFLATAPGRGGGAVVPAQVWSDRRLERGDVIMFELSVGVAGDTSQVLRTISVGPPSPSGRRLHAVADEAVAAILGVVRPGAPVGDLLAAAGVIDEAGFAVVDDVVHGYGGGYLPPVLRTPRTQRRPPAERVLEPGMMLVVQPNVVDPDRSLGVQTGELVVVTPDGYERFHRLPTGLLEIAG
jgi:Xaa-Pro aminopeptidase